MNIFVQFILIRVYFCLKRTMLIICYLFKESRVYPFVCYCYQATLLVGKEVPLADMSPKLTTSIY